MTAVNPPPLTRIPDKFLEDPEVRTFFEQNRQILFQLWQRTGGGTDDVEGSLDHVNLSNIGANTHPTLDTGLANSTTHIADTSIHTEDNLLAHLAGIETFSGAKAFSEIIDSAKGISFPATQVASADVNTLDDYEEGSWTLTISDASGNDSSSTSTGYYTKTGREVTANFFGTQNISTVGMTAGDEIRISLPFTSNSTTGGSSGTIVLDTFNVTPDVVHVCLRLNLNRNYMRLYETIDNGVDSVMFVSDITTGTSDFLSGSITYFI